MSEGNNQTATTAAIESLRVILEHEQSRHIPYEEALEVGESLISFFELLAEEEEQPL